jgi:hypothetical protein
MTPAWAQRQEALLRDCVVSPDVFTPMVDRLRDFVRPYQYALETEAGKRNVYLYLAGLLSHLPRKNAEDIATLVDVERQVMQDFIGTALWDHRPLVQVLVGEVVERLGEPDGIIAFDPSSFPKVPFPRGSRYSRGPVSARHTHRVGRVVGGGRDGQGTRISSGGSQAVSCRAVGSGTTRRSARAVFSSSREKKV